MLDQPVIRDYLRERVRAQLRAFYESPVAKTLLTVP
jgi:hypothetical protein